MTSFEFTDKTVLITGGSMGIGAELAREVTRRGAKVVLVARSEDKLAALAKTLPGATWLAEDLGRPGAAQRIFETLSARGVAIDVLINNAGVGSHGGFVDTSLVAQRAQIDLNIGALVELTHWFLPMLEARRGGVIQVASTAAFQPVPYMAVYAATKAFVLSFSEALWGEYRQRGVRVLALCPGATDTPFFDHTGEVAALGKKAAPADVVALGLRAFAKNRSYVIHGTANWLTAMSSRFATRELTAKLTAKIMQPKPTRALTAAAAK